MMLDIATPKVHVSIQIRSSIDENYLNSDRDPTSSIACLKVVSSCLKVPLTFGTFEGHNSIILGL